MPFVSHEGSCMWGWGMGGGGCPSSVCLCLRNPSHSPRHARRAEGPCEFFYSTRNRGIAVIVVAVDRGAGMATPATTKPRPLGHARTASRRRGMYGEARVLCDLAVTGWGIRRRRARRIPVLSIRVCCRACGTERCRAWGVFFLYVEALFQSFTGAQGEGKDGGIGAHVWQ